MAIEADLSGLSDNVWLEICAASGENDYEYLDTYMKQKYAASWKCGSNDIWIFECKEKYTEFALTWM